jgi:hypothetical protein
MTKYCPRCENEFFDTVLVCPDDGTKLSKTKPQPNAQTPVYDIYAAANEVEAERIITLLRDKEIDASAYQSNDAIIPASSDLHFMISVPATVREKATTLIKHARSDGVISELGLFLPLS